MKTIDHHFIRGKFVPSHGQDVISSINPTTGEIIGRAVLGDEVDARKAIDAAKVALSRMGCNEPRRAW